MAIADLIMPKMGESIMEATILKWHKKVGEHVKMDETVLDIATDKVDSEIPSPVAGIITEILFPVNNVVPVGSVIAKIQTDVSVSIGNNPLDGHTIVSEIHTPQPKVVEPSIIPIIAQPVAQPITQNIQEPVFMESTHKSYEENTPFQPYTTSPKTGNNRFFSPLVLNIANSEGISLSELELITGTGADGRVSKKDVLQYIADKRSGKVGVFVPNQNTEQAVYTPPPPAKEYYHQSIAEPAPIQHAVQNKVADTPVYIAPQPSVQPIVELPNHFQSIIEAPVDQSVFHEPVIYPQPQQEYKFHEPIAEQVYQPDFENLPKFVETVPQPIFEPFSQKQPVEEHFHQSLIEPPVEQAVIESVQFLPQPIVESIPQAVVEPIQFVPQPIVESIPQAVVEPVQFVPQPIREPIPQPNMESVQFVSQPIVEPIQQPIIETVIHQVPVVENVAPVVEETIIAQPVIHENKAEAFTAVEPTPIVEPVYQQSKIVEVVPIPKAIETVLQQPIIDTVANVPPLVKETIIEPVHQTKVEIPTSPVQESVQQKPIPVYLIPATTPTVPLVTLAEGGSGKYTTPDSAHPSGNVEIIEMDRMRKLISKHMVESKQISAHVTSFTEADVTNMVFWRERVKQDFERREGTKLTFTPMFIDCIVKVLKKYPLMNSSVEGDKIIIKKDLNIGMATALPTGNLIVPVIKGADQLNIVGLSAAVNKLATSARANQLKPDDITGGTFTFTNVGTFGTLMGTPIINQPQVAILAVGVIKKRPVVIESPNNDTIGIRHMMYLSLSYDHRVIDGSVGASFLSDVAKEMEAWDLNRTWYHYL